MYLGPGWTTDAFVVASLKGVLGSLDVRRALSLALDRQGIISSVYQGAALMPRWLSNPGTFGYGMSVFDNAYDSSPVLTPDIAEARKLVRQAVPPGRRSPSAPPASCRCTRAMPAPTRPPRRRSG